MGTGAPEGKALARHLDLATLTGMALPTDLFAAPVPEISLAEAEAHALRLFGVRGQARQLSGERDQNFHLRVPDGPGYVFKVHPPAEDPAVVEMQIGALQHLAAVAPDLAVPRVVLTRDGGPTATVDLGAGPQLARLLSYVPGLPMDGFRPLNDARLRSLGQHLAALDRALQGYQHPAGEVVLLWDVQHAAQVRPLLPHIPDDDVRGIAERALDRFEAIALPQLPGLRSQLLHNDANPYNVLYDAVDTERIGGFLDFGDMVRAPLICELAVTAAYHITDDVDPLGATRTLVDAYHAVLPLTAEERDVLPDLILARTVLSVTINCWRASLEPEEREQILATYPKAVQRMRRMAGVRLGAPGRGATR